MAALPGLPKIAQPVNVAAPESTSDLRPIDRRISVSRGAISCTEDGQDRGDMQAGGNGKNPNVSGVLGECKNGSGGRDRTADRRIMIPLLYQLSYAATEIIISDESGLFQSAAGR
jgi:hypothetical protein